MGIKTLGEALVEVGVWVPVYKLFETPQETLT